MSAQTPIRRMTAPRITVRYHALAVMPKAAAHLDAMRAGTDPRIWAREGALGGFVGFRPL